MKLSVPFIVHDPYIRFLDENRDCLDSIYFALDSGPVLDSRIRFRQTPLSDLAEGLNRIPDVRKYALLNSRFIHPNGYHDPAFLSGVTDSLTFLVSHAGLQGLVFSDFYFLNALSGTGKAVIGRLEAVPGINCMMDSHPKVSACLDLIRESGFRMPGKITLDRGLNRDPVFLKQTAEKIRDRCPAIRIELLANEGCIHHCPFKLTHDAQISFANLGLSSENSHLTNRLHGCHDFFFRNPERFLNSPFIRPEDLGGYSGTADAVKISGRTLGPGFLTACIRAYAAGSLDGNLLSLMDASHWLSERFHLDNKKLDPGFLKMVTSCQKNCTDCTACRDLFAAAATIKPFGIREYPDNS